MGVRMLSEGHHKMTFLTTKPANPAAPTAAELNAGIDASCLITREGFAWTMADSDTVDDAPLCTTGKAVAPGPDNYNLAITLYRWWKAVGGPGADATADALHAATKTKGAVLWGYHRITDKLSTEDWATADEIHLGAEVWCDWPQDVTGGWIKERVPVHANQGWPHIVVAGGA